MKLKYQREERKSGMKTDFLFCSPPTTEGTIERMTLGDHMQTEGKSVLEIETSGVENPLAIVMLT